MKLKLDVVGWAKEYNFFGLTTEESIRLANEGEEYAEQLIAQMTGSSRHWSATGIDGDTRLQVSLDGTPLLLDTSLMDIAADNLGDADSDPMFEITSLEDIVTESLSGESGGDCDLLLLRSEHKGRVISAEFEVSDSEKLTFVSVIAGYDELSGYDENLIVGLAFSDSVDLEEAPNLREAFDDPYVHVLQPMLGQADEKVRTIEAFRYPSLEKINGDL